MTKYLKHGTQLKMTLKYLHLTLILHIGNYTYEHNYFEVL